MSRNKVYPKENDDALRDTVKKLKGRLRKAEKLNKQLLSEIRTLETAFAETKEFLRDYTGKFNVDKVVKAVQRGKTLETLVEKQYEEDKKQVRAKTLKEQWVCYKCNTGILRLLIIPRQDGVKYFRRCDNHQCKNRTRLKDYTPDVEGIKVGEDV